LECEFGVTIDWQGYELWPEELEWPEPGPPETPNPNRPATPTRIEFLFRIEGVPRPTVPRPPRLRTFHAHQAVESAREHGNEDAMVERIYRALWERGENINDPDVLIRLAEGLVPDLDELRHHLHQRPHRDRIVGFDDPAYAVGVFNLPTFFIGNERYAEQPYAVLAEAVARELGETRSAPYRGITFPPGPENRPYTYINMVATIDGKILTGERDEHVDDLGSEVDRATLHRLEATADAVLVGAQTLRATSPRWNPASPIRVVVSGSGNLPWDSLFLTGGESYVAYGGPNPPEVHAPVRALQAGTQELDLTALLANLRARGVERLLVLGGSEINAQLLAADLVDELFLTVAPKVKLGRDVPTYADGDALPRENVLSFGLVEHTVVADELFLRYRRR
jgi:riboflavin biosynthesis pyrimidine reductase